MNAVFADAEVENPASVRVLEKSGMQYEFRDRSLVRYSSATLRSR